MPDYKNRLSVAAAGMALACGLLLMTTTPAAAEASPQGCAPAGTAYPETAEGAACRLADELERAFVIPAQGEAYAAALRAHVAAGRYATLAGEEAARTITRDLQQVAPDGHLRVELMDQRRQPGGHGPGERPALLEHGGWLAPGVAFIRINALMLDAEQNQALERFMEEHADANAIIFDLRTNGGGGLAEMDVIFPWLFGEETRLVAMAMRRSVEEQHGSPFGSQSTPTLRILDGTPQMTVREHWAVPNADPRLRDARVFVLTSPRTGSAAEHFGLAMKHTGRATLVGSATAGANHFGGGIPLAGGLGAFMPAGRTYDPLTGEDWEGTGIAPDIEVAPAEALVRVLEELGHDKASARRLSEGVAPTLSMERHQH